MYKICPKCNKVAASNWEKYGCHQCCYCGECKIMILCESAQKWHNETISKIQQNRS